MSLTYVTVGVLLALDGADWLVTRKALRLSRSNATEPPDAVRLHPGARSRLVVGLGGNLLVILVLVIVARPANTSLPVAAVLTAAIFLPGVLSIVRVLRYDTGLAVSRLTAVALHHMTELLDMTDR